MAINPTLKICIAPGMFLAVVGAFTLVVWRASNLDIDVSDHHDLPVVKQLRDLYEFDPKHLEDYRYLIKIRRYSIHLRMATLSIVRRSYSRARMSQWFHPT